MLNRCASWFGCMVLACMMVSSAFAAEQSDLDKLQGKWQCKRTNENGEKISQVIEIKKDKLVFRILDADGNLALYATADVKLEKLGPFSVLTAKNVKAGNSEDSLEMVDDVFAHPYQLEYGTLYVGANFDKMRNQNPRVDTYNKVGN